MYFSFAIVQLTVYVNKSQPTICLLTVCFDTVVFIASLFVVRYWSFKLQGIISVSDWITELFKQGNSK